MVHVWCQKHKDFKVANCQKTGKGTEWMYCLSIIGGVGRERRGKVCADVFLNSFVDNAYAAKAHLFSQDVFSFRLQWKLSSAFEKFLVLQNT